MTCSNYMTLFYSLYTTYMNGGQRKRDNPPPLPSVTGELFQRLSEKKRDSETFVRVVQSRKVAVGPLEYCALGQRVVRGGVKGAQNWWYVKFNPVSNVTCSVLPSLASLVVCHASPALPTHFRQREAAGIQRKSDGRHKLGSRKKAAARASGPGGWEPKVLSKKRKGDVLTESSRAATTATEVSEVTDGPLRKKTRVRADQQVIQDGASAVLERRLRCRTLCK